jgi:hypothetical protein
MAIYPCLRALPPQCGELPEEPTIGVEFAPGPKSTHNVVGANRMDEHALCVTLAQFPAINQLCHESDVAFLHVAGSAKLSLIPKFSTKDRDGFAVFVVRCDGRAKWFTATLEQIVQIRQLFRSGVVAS